MGGLGACLGRCLCGGAAAEGRKEVTVVTEEGFSF